MRPLLAALFIPVLLAAPLPAQAPHKLLIVSIDGLDARFLNDPALRVKAPNIRKLMRTGASATVVGVAPSGTWPANASIATGAPPFQHGIAAQEFNASSFRVETLWGAATRLGLKTATVFWPATLGAAVAFNLPEYWEAKRGNAVPLDAIARKSTPAGTADRIGRMFPPFDKELWDDSSAGAAATWLLATEKPDIAFVHMSEVDAEQHETRALSIYARELLESDDDIVGQLMAKAPPGTIVAIVSDHGIENGDRIVRPRVALRQAGIRGPVEVEDGLIGTSDKTVAAFLRKQIALGRKSGIAREVPMAEVRAKAPSLARWVAAFDTLPDHVASAEDRGPAVGPGTHLGVHDFWPTRPNFRGVFILAGAGVHPVKLGEIDMLQIAPTFADIVGVKLPAARYTSLWHTVSK